MAYRIVNVNTGVAYYYSSYSRIVIIKSTLSWLITDVNTIVAYYRRGLWFIDYNAFTGVEYS